MAVMDDTSVHECNISDSQSIISVTRLLALKLHTFLLVEGYSAKFGHSVLFVEKLQKTFHMNSTPYDI